MSTCWRLSNEESGLPREEFLARLGEHGIHLVEEGKCGGFQISDGDGFVWCHTGEHEDKYSQFETFADSGNPSGGIREAIEEITGENMLSEHDHGFWREEELLDEQGVAGDLN